VDQFLEDASGLFETAMAAAVEDSSLGEVAILLDSSRAIRIVDATGWQLDALRLDTGASAVYRIAKRASGVSLEGRSGPRSCTLRSDRGNRSADYCLNGVA